MTRDHLSPQEQELLFSHSVMDQDYESRLLRQINIQNDNSSSPVVSSVQFTHVTVIFNLYSREVWL